MSNTGSGTPPTGVTVVIPYLYYEPDEFKKGAFPTPVRNSHVYIDLNEKGKFQYFRTDEIGKLCLADPPKNIKREKPANPSKDSIWIKYPVVPDRKFKVVYDEGVLSDDEVKKLGSRTGNEYALKKRDGKEEYYFAVPRIPFNIKIKGIGITVVSFEQFDKAKEAKIMRGEGAK